MRGKRPSLAALAVAGLVLAQLAGCGGCVKDDPKPTQVQPGGRKPINPRAVDQQLSPPQFGTRDGSSEPADASHD